MVASTPTLASEPALAPARPNRKRLGLRLGLGGLTVLAVVLFSLYAAYLASRVDDVIEPVPIDAPSKGATDPLSGGAKAPDFQLNDLSGKSVKLSDFAGRPIWVNVWASWCAPCRAEMPDVSTAFSEATNGRGNDGGGLVLLSVSVGENPDEVSRYLQSAKYKLPVLVDPAFDITQRYRVTGLPTHYFIGRDGVVKSVAIGGLHPAGMRSRLQKILG